MKIATDIEQSKKLVELGIDTSTADMSWYQPNIMYPYELHTKYKGHGVMTDGSDSLIPAWSLSALMSAIPFLTLIRDEEGWYGECENGTIVSWNIEAIDTCYEMIIKLHEQKIL